MGALCSCCGGSKDSLSEQAYQRPVSRPPAPPSEADLQARQNAADAAAAREQKFNASAGGKAARKAVANVAKEREADAKAAQNRKDIAQDWLS